MLMMLRPDLLALRKKVPVGNLQRNHHVCDGIIIICFNPNKSNMFLNIFLRWQSNTIHYVNLFNGHVELQMPHS